MEHFLNFPSPAVGLPLRLRGHGLSHLRSTLLCSTATVFVDWKRNEPGRPASVSWTEPQPITSEIPAEEVINSLQPITSEEVINSWQCLQDSLSVLSEKIKRSFLHCDSHSLSGHFHFVFLLLPHIFQPPVSSSSLTPPVPPFSSPLALLPIFFSSPSLSSSFLRFLSLFFHPFCPYSNSHPSSSPAQWSSKLVFTLTPFFLSLPLSTVQTYGGLEVQNTTAKENTQTQNLKHNQKRENTNGKKYIFAFVFFSFLCLNFIFCVFCFAFFSVASGFYLLYLRLHFFSLALALSFAVVFLHS